MAPSPTSPARAAQGERLQKVLASAGLGSRRQCEELIVEGRVEIDRKVVTELGTRVDPSEHEIRFDGEPLISSGKKVYLALHKPTGVLCTNRDPSGRPRAVDLVPPSEGRLFTVGRLDMSSEGLVLLTNDGDLANRLAHPRYGIRKVYQVQVAGEVVPDTIARLRKGFHLAESFCRAVDVRLKSAHKKSSMLEMVLDEGRNREVRRMLARCGHKVQRLIRVAIGPLRLADMPSGAYRPLTKRELELLRDPPANTRTSSDSKSESESKSTAKPTGPARRKPGRPAGGSFAGSGPAKRGTGYAGARKTSGARKTPVGQTARKSRRAR